jgi:hypothetical protein
MNTRETHGYILTFCCVNCGKHEVFAWHPCSSKNLHFQARDQRPQY